jgi:hypothetical protein
MVVIDTQVTQEAFMNGEVSFIRNQLGCAGVRKSVQPRNTRLHSTA